MNWQPQLELEFVPSRVAMTLLLILFFIFAIPLVRERHILCIEYPDEDPRVIHTIWTNPPMEPNPDYGDNCYSRDLRITVFVGLREEFYHTYSRIDSETGQRWTQTTLVMKRDFLWLLLAIPLAYFLSAPLKSATIDVWRSGSRKGLLNLVLVAATMLPGLAASGVDPDLFVWPFLSVYGFPLLLFLSLFVFPTFLELTILVILSISAIVVALVLTKVLITQRSVMCIYILWIVYLIGVYIGVYVILFL